MYSLFESFILTWSREIIKAHPKYIRGNTNITCDSAGSTAVRGGCVLVYLGCAFIIFPWCKFEGPNQKIQIWLQPETESRLLGPYFTPGYVCCWPIIVSIWAWYHNPLAHRHLLSISISIISVFSLIFSNLAKFLIIWMCNLLSYSNANFSTWETSRQIQNNPQTSTESSGTIICTHSCPFYSFILKANTSATT